MANIVIEDQYGLMRLFGVNDSKISNVAKQIDKLPTNLPIGMNAGDILLYSGASDPLLNSQYDNFNQLNDIKLFQTGNSTTSLPEQILANNQLMDSLRKEIRKRPRNIAPIVLTSAAAVLASELKVGMMMQGTDVVASDIYPSRQFLETNPVTSLNSKYTQSLMLGEYDRLNGTNFLPKTEVATSNEEAVEMLLNMPNGKLNCVLKEDLSCGGYGVFKLKTILDEDLLKTTRARDYNQLLTALLKAKGLNASIEHPLLIQENIFPLLSNPSIEMFVPPLQKVAGLNQDPWITYGCDMMISDGQFMGVRIPDPHEIPAYANAADYNPRKNGYNQALSSLKKAALDIAKIYQQSGFVGIMDCDCGITVNDKEEISGKIFEFNIGRNTGGTLASVLLKKAGLGQQSTAISLDFIRWKDMPSQSPTKALMQQLNQMLFHPKRGGFVLTGVHKDKKYFSGIYIARNFRDADTGMNWVVKETDSVI